MTGHEHDAPLSPSRERGGAKRRGEGEYRRVPSAPAKVKQFAKELRQTSTEAEKKLWGILRHRRFDQHKFRRQVPLGPFVADFACYAARLIVELDGSEHGEGDYDQRRDRWFANNNFRVLRVWNNELYDNRDGVLEAILHALNTPPHPASLGEAPLSREGERGDAAPIALQPAISPSGERLPSEARPGEGQFNNGERS